MSPPHESGSRGAGHGGTPGFRGRADDRPARAHAVLPPALEGAGAVVGWIGFALGLVATVLVASRLGRAWGFVAIPALLATIVLLARLYDHVLVGRDGIRLSRYHRHAFVPYSLVRSVDVTDTGVVLRLVTGRTVTLPTRTRDRISEPLAMNVPRDELVADLRARMTALPPEAPELPASLAREGEPIRSWVARLRSSAARGGSYRSSAPARDQLWRVIESPSAAEQDRVAAAIALGTPEDELERERLRVAADGSASPRIRLAVDAVAAEASEEDLVRALSRRRDG